MITEMKTRQWPERSKISGFTIVELLIVIVVIGILAAISIVAYNGIRTRAIDSNTKNDLANAGRQIETSAADSGFYPSSTNEINSGKGLFKSDSTTFIYSGGEDNFKLTAYSDSIGTKAFCISSSSRSVSEGPCLGHTISTENDTNTNPATADSCFTFNPANGSISNYSNDTSCPRDVVIPNNIAGVPVRTIAEAAFFQGPKDYSDFPEEADRLNSVTIPSSVTNIQDWAFSYNRLSNIEIPSLVTNIGFMAFGGNNLDNVSLPSSLVTIGGYAFYTNRLDSITIPNTVTSIGIGAFRQNFIASVEIGESVTFIGEESFASNRITSLTIPNSVITVADMAFSGNQIASLTIGESVESIGISAFRVNDLTNLTIPNSVVTIAQTAFESNDLTSVTIGSSVETIGGWAFAFNNLSSIVIPNSVLQIEQHAFMANTDIVCRVPASKNFPGIGCSTVDPY